MISKKVLDNEIENLIGLNNMVRSFEEIAAGRIKQSRTSVLLNRTFMTEINTIFSEVIYSYKRQVESLMQEKKSKKTDKFSFINKNGKTLYLLISANTGLYGTIVKRTFDLFLQKTKEKDSDIAIIGKLGLSMWENSKVKRKYFYFDFPDQKVDEKKLDEILNFIISYEKVVIFYGEFQNLMKQNATYSDISGNTYAEKISSQPPIKYYFEPSLVKILEFFEKQIFSSIFEQTVRESQLAKIASRLTTLDSASENIYKKLTNITSQKNRNAHYEQNKKQLETFASKVLWRNM